MNTSFSSRHYFFLSKEFGCKKITKKSRLKVFFVRVLFSTILLNSPFYYEAKP